MKRFGFDSGIAIAGSSEGKHTLMLFPAPVVWTDVSHALKSKLPGSVTIKVVVDRGSEAGFRQWVRESGTKVLGERVLEAGERRDLEFDEVTGRFRIEMRREPVKVMIVDDSKAMRMILRKGLESSPLIQVVGEAEKPSVALTMLEKTKPDVITLDIQMPEMSGVELLKKIEPMYHIPAVMVSALGINEGNEVMSALEAGAFDYFQKPEAGEMQAQVALLQEKILLAAESGKRKRRPQIRSRSAMKGPTVGRISDMELLAVGASTGGTEAIRQVFEVLPADIPPIVVVQHIPPFFSAAFADRLNKLCAFEVREARDGDEIKRGLALIAPGGKHLEVVRASSGKLTARITDAAPVNRFKPSVDVLFRSVAKEFGDHSRNVTAVIMTGMGSDGAKGLLELRKAGARTIGQDEESCVVYGMPRAAAEMGACAEVAPLGEIANLLTKSAAKPKAS